MQLLVLKNAIIGALECIYWCLIMQLLLLPKNNWYLGMQLLVLKMGPMDTLKAHDDIFTGVKEKWRGHFILKTRVL